MKVVVQLMLALLPLLPALYTAPDLTAPNLPKRNHFPSDIWKNCSDKKDPIVVESVSIYPDPPKKGRPLSLTAHLMLEEVVSNGSVTVQLHWGIVPMLKKVWPLCEFTKSQHMHCPLKKGPLRIAYNTTVSTKWPDGRFNGSAVAVDVNGRELLCVTVDFQMLAFQANAVATDQNGKELACINLDMTI